MISVRTDKLISWPRVVIDVGGTHVRFGMAASNFDISQVFVSRASEFPDLETAIRTYLARATNNVALVVLAVNGPIQSDKIVPTNSCWSPFSLHALSKSLGHPIVVLNDFVAQALAMPTLEMHERIELGTGKPVRDAPIGVLGPGTGLGVSAILPDSGEWRVVPSEGGHVSFAPQNETQAIILKSLRAEFGHVSNERVVAGPGLSKVASIVAEIAGASLPLLEPEEIGNRARNGCLHCRRTIDTFSRILGSVAGDLAITFLAQGGIYITGGVARGLSDLLNVGEFRAGFTEKGRLAAMLTTIPTYLVIGDNIGLRGAAAYRGESGHRGHDTKVL